MIQALQIIILMPLMNANMPANTGMFFNELAAIAAFDLFETNEMMTEKLDLLPRDPVDEKFETIGLGTVYFMNNLGTFVFALAFKFLLILIWFALYALSSISFFLQKCEKRLSASIFWNSWITVITQTFVIVGLCAMIALEHNLELGSPG